MTESKPYKKRIAIFSPHQDYFGDTRSMPILARSLTKKGYQVDLLRTWCEWEGSDTEAGPVRIIDLGAHKYMPILPNIRKLSKMVSYRLEMAAISVAMMPGLVRYLRREKPHIVIARMMTVPAVIGKIIAHTSVRVVLSTGGIPHKSLFRRMLWPHFYPRADYFVACAEGIADVASELSNVQRDRYHIIPDAVIDESVINLSNEPANHPWFSKDAPPVVVAMWRLSRQKDFPTLLKAFALVRKKIESRLMILGEGEDRADLEKLILELGLTQDVELSGFHANPFKFLRAADLFVLSSLWEGVSHALVEAQAVGTPAISTDCPAGQRDTLLNGEAGTLVPVGDHVRMSESIVDLLIDKVKADQMAQRGLANSIKYTPEAVSSEWAKLINKLI